MIQDEIPGLRQTREYLLRRWDARDLVSLGSLAILRIPGFAFLCSLRDNVSLRRWKTQNGSRTCLLALAKEVFLLASISLSISFFLPTILFFSPPRAGFPFFAIASAIEVQIWMGNGKSQEIEVKSRKKNQDRDKSEG